MSQVQLWSKLQGSTKYIQLDLHEAEPIKLVLSVQNIEDPLAATSVFSRTFRVPHTSVNGPYFKAVFNVNSTNYDAGVRADSYIMDNGQLFTNGNILLNAVYVNEEDKNIEYEITFLGETSDFGAKIGGGFLNELDMSRYNHTKNYANISTSWYGGLFQGDLTYGLIEWGYTYTPSNQPVQPTLSNGFAKSFTNVANPLNIEQWKPQYRAKVLWDQIFNESGYTYDSTFLDSTFFEKLYIITENAANAFLNNNNTFKANSSTGGASTVGTYQIRALTETDDPGNNYKPEISTYIAPTSGSYSFKVGFTAAAENSTYLNVDMSLQVYNATTRTVIDFYDFNIDNNWDPGCDYCGQNTVISKTFTVLANAGDKIQFNLAGQPTTYQTPKSLALTNISLSCVFAPEVFSASSILPSNVRKVDFMRSIINRFRLVFEPSKDIKNHFTITPWKDWILTGVSRDWTDKLDTTKDLKIKPMFYSQNRFQIYKDQEDGDYLNYNYQLTYKQTIGQLNIDSDNELITGTKTYQDQFAPCPIAPIGFKDGDIPGSQFLIPHIAKDSGSQQDVGSTVISGKREPVQPKLRLVFYNGLVPAPINWYAAQGANGLNPIQLSQYPLMSQYSAWPITDSTYDLNWSNSEPFWDITDGALGTGKTSLSTFNVFWKTWYDTTFDPYSRIVEANIVLDYKDMLDFKFNDYVFIKDAWYFVNKINNYIVGQNTNCRVELIKLGNNIGIIVPVVVPPIPQYPEVMLCRGDTACDAYCCNTPGIISTIYYRHVTDTGTSIYLDPAGNVPAESGYYSDGSETFFVNGNGLITTNFNNDLCSCVTEVYEFEVIIANDPCGACCLTGGSTITVFGIYSEFYSNLELYLDYNLTIPASTGYYILSPGTSVLVIQNGSVEQIYDCNTCDCTDLYSHLVKHADTLCDACCGPYVTVWTNNATWESSTEFYSNNSGTSLLTSGYYSQNGSVIEVLSGTYVSPWNCDTCPDCPAKPIEVNLEIEIASAGYLTQIQLEQSLDNGNSFQLLEALVVQPGDADLNPTLQTSADIGAILRATYFSNAVGGSMDAQIYVDTISVEQYPITPSPATFTQLFLGPLDVTKVYEFKLVVDITYTCDDTLIVGGGYSNYNGAGWPGGGNIKGILGLELNGSINQDFNFVGGLTIDAAGAIPGVIWDIKSWNNKLVISGEFGYYKGIQVTIGLIVLELNGSVYEPFQSLEGAYSIGGGDKPYGRWVEVVEDAAYIGGEFTYWNESALGSGGTDYYLASPKMVKIDLTDGSIDKTFNAKFDGTDKEIEVIKEYNGYIYVGGYIVGYNGVNSDRWLLKLDTTGTKDPTFTTNIGSYVLDMEFEGDYIYVCGNMGGRIDRLHLATGLIDTTWIHESFNETVEAINIVGDLIYCVGDFISYGATSINRIAAINKTTGALDTSFNVGTGLNALARNAIIGGNWLYVTGDFTTYNGVTVNRILKVSIVDATRDPAFLTGTGFTEITIGLYINSCYVPPPTICNLQTLNFSATSACDAYKGTGTSVSNSYWTDSLTLGTTSQLLTCATCGDIPIVPVDCVMSAWSAWSTCTLGEQTRTRTVITPASGGGTPCGDLTETQACTPTYRCVSYTVATTAGFGTSTTYIDCDGVEQTVVIGGVGGYDATTFCARENTVQLGIETWETNNGECNPQTTCDQYKSTGYDDALRVDYTDCNGVRHDQTYYCYSSLCTKTICAAEIHASSENMINQGPCPT